MKPKYTPEQIAEVLSLEQQGLTLRQISVKLGIPRGSVGAIIHRSEQPKKPKKPKKPKEKPPKTESRELNVDQKIKRNAAKLAQAQQRFDDTQIGDRITVFYPREKGFNRVSGEVVAKYPRTLSIINDKGRRDSITVADLMNYRVV